MIRRARIVLASIALCGTAACVPRFGCKAETPNPNTAPDSFVVALETSRGRVDIMARKHWAPIGVHRFHTLVNDKHFDDARFFRVLEDFVAQFGLAGDPKANDAWASRCLADEPAKHANTRGTLTFAIGGPETRSTQMFINLKDNANLGADFAPIGEVVSGMDAVDSLYSGYGDAAPRSGPQYGLEGPRQDSIGRQGNAYLLRGWPKLDYIKTARVVQEWPAR
jgi:peptidyl-prolyl cis-trans isomerase A (cyclophilin A)